LIGIVSKENGDKYYNNNHKPYNSITTPSQEIDKTNSNDINLVYVKNSAIKTKIIKAYLDSAISLIN